MLYLLIGYLFLYIHRPFEVWPVLGTFRVELIYMLGTMGAWAVAGDKRLSFNSLTVAVLGLAGVVVFCCLVSPWSEHSYNAIESWLKLLVFFILLITSVHDEQSLRKLITAFLVVMALYMLHSFYEYMCGRYVVRMGICRMVGVDTTTSDPNAFALSVVLSLAFLPVCWKHYDGMLHRALMLGYFGLSVLCISLTGSRGGFVCLLVFVVVAIWNSPWRNRLAALAIPLAPLLFLALPPEMQNRFVTIVNPDVGPKNAKLSTDVRVEGFWIGMRLWQENPLSGVGPGCWRVATRRKLESHNLYGQVPGELGTLGVLGLSGVVVAYVINLRRIRRAYRERPEWPEDFVYQLTTAIGLGLALLLLGGTGGHNLFRAHWVLFAAFLIIARQSLAQRPEPAEAVYQWQGEALPDFAAERASMTAA